MVKTLDRKRYMDEKEVAQLEKATKARALRDLRCGWKTWVRNWMMIDLASSTGLRVGELCSIRFGSFTPQGLVVQRQKKKSRVGPDTLPVISRLRDHLYEYALWCADHGVPAGPEDYVIVGFRGGPNSRGISTRGATLAFKSCLRNAGLDEGYGTHALRHAMGFRLLRATGNMRMVQQQLGHENLVTTEIYAHTSFDDRLAALETTA